MANDCFDPLHKDIKRHAASGVVYTGLAQAAKILAQFVSVVVTARLLDPADFGLVAMVSPIYAFAVMFHDLGLSQATMQKPELTSEQVNSFFWINVGVGAIICLALILFSPLVGLFYGDNRAVSLTAAMALLVFLGGLGNQHGAVMARQMLFRPQAILSIVSTVGALAGVILWAYFFGGYWSLYVGMVLGTVLPVIGVWYYIPWRPGKPAIAADTLGMLRYGLGLTSANFTNFVVQNANSVVIGRLLGERPLGLYDRASRLLSSPLQHMISPIGNVILPLLYRLHDNDDKYRRTFLRTTCSITLAISPGVIWAIVMADLLVKNLLGPQWLEASPIFAALSFAALPQLVNGCAYWLFITQGRSGDLVRLSLFNGFFSLAALIIGLRFGIIGVAVASVISQLLRTPPLWMYACRSGPVRVRSVIMALIPQTLGCAIAFGILEEFRNVVPDSTYFLLISGLVLSYLLVIGVVSMFPSGRDAIRKDFEFGKFLLAQALKKVSI